MVLVMRVLYDSIRGIYDSREEHDDASDAPSGYTPDPEAETAMLVEAFFGALCERFADPAGFRGRVRRRHETLVSQQQGRVVDQPSRYNLRTTLAVLAAYQELSPEIDDAVLLPALRAAFVEPLEQFVRSATRSLLDAAEDPFAAMVTLTRDRERHAFGQGSSSLIPRTIPDGIRHRWNAATTTRCSRPTAPST